MEKKCSKCLNVKPLSDFNKKKKAIDGHRSECKSCVNKYYEANKEKIRKRKLKYRKLNKNLITLQRKEYYQNNRKKEITNNLCYYNKNKKAILDKNKTYNKNNRNKRNILAKNYRLRNRHIMAWRYILSNSLKRLGKSKQSKTIDLLGYSALELKEYLENLFTKNMHWDNYGKWHIDHIKPVSKFDPNTPMCIVNALNNLQPLWGIENIKKGAKMITS